MSSNNRSFARYAAVTSLVLLAGCSPDELEAPADVGNADAPASAITADRIRETVLEIGDDRYAGRAPGTEGDRMTRAYLARELQRMGFAPGVDGTSYEQPFDLVGINAAQPAAWQFESAGGSLALEQGSEFIAASGVQAPRAAIDNAELVFVGFGIEAPEYEWDDFADADVSGKVLVMLNNDPDWDPNLFEGETRLYYGRWSYKYESAARHNAAGAIIIHTTESAGYPWQVVQTSWSGEQFELPDVGEPRIQVEAWVTEGAARRIFNLAGLDLETLVEQAKSREFAPVPLGVTTSIDLPTTLNRTRTANVLGVLEGSDPAVADEYVIYTAHHDHLGVSEDESAADRIYNGARDNASGVGMVLAIGDAFAALAERPRRSIMLLFVAAEESGLLGSEFYASNPTVPPGRIAANVNFDSGNIWGPTRDVAFVGMGKSTLDAVGSEIAARQGRVLLPDNEPDQGLYYRSDQFNFAKIGVPAFYFEPGSDFVDRPDGWGAEQRAAYNDQHYHQPSDELDESWDFTGMVQDAELGFEAGLAIANADALPAWNPGDEFEAARQEALAELD
jgi:Zn-dependent M28 family amino/carboxypeptidase